MKYIRTPKSFLNYDYLNESMFYISNDFKDKLKSIDSPISKELLSVVQTDVKPDMTFIKNSDKEGFVEFTQIDNAIRNLEKSGKNLTEFVDEDTGEIGKFDLKTKKWLNEDGEEVKPKANFDQLIQLISKEVKTKNQLKIGKLINKIFPGKFKDKEVEDFVNKFKSESESSDKFDIVKGEDIAYWYDCRNYIYSIKGVLNSSCMKNMNEEVFDIYTSNPDVCRMVILKNEDDELIGRALVWKVNLSEGDIDFNPQLVDVKYFMDRIYHTEDSDVERFKKLAQSKGWAYKAQQSFLNLTEIIYNGKPYEVTMEVNVKPVRYDRYPYMDTFASYDPDDGILVNLEQSCFLIEGEFEISTRGEEGYAEGEGGVWSEWHGENIDDYDVTYSERLSTYIRGDVAVSLKVDGWEDFMPRDHPDVIYNNNMDEWLYKPNTLYSERDDEYYPTNESFEAITEIGSSGEAKRTSFVWEEDLNIDYLDFEDNIPSKYLKYFESEWEGLDYISKDLLTKDKDDNFIPKILAIRTYEVDDNVWLSEPDAFLLKGINLKGRKLQFDSQVEDKITYFKRFWKDKNIVKIITQAEKRISGEEEKELLEEYMNDENTLYHLQDFYYRLSGDTEGVKYTTVEESKKLDFTTLPQPKSSKGPLMSQEKPYVHGQDNYKAKGYETTKWSFEDERKGWSKLGLKKFKDFTKTNEGNFLNKIEDMFSDNLSEDDKVFKDILDNFDEVNIIGNKYKYKSFEYNGEFFHIDPQWDVTKMIYYYDNDGKSKSFKSDRYIGDLIRKYDNNYK